MGDARHLAEAHAKRLPYIYQLMSKAKVNLIRFYVLMSAFFLSLQYLQDKHLLPLMNLQTSLKVLPWLRSSYFRAVAMCANS